MTLHQPRLKEIDRSPVGNLKNLGVVLFLFSRRKRSIVDEVEDLRFQLGN